jgi:SAM-dependent methyltransferase
MNIAVLRDFAPAVRRQLIEAVSLKLDHVLTARTPDYVDTYALQVAAIRKLAEADRTGLVERVAYTWFNRLAALRFLDARGWHPFGVRVLTAAATDETQPELLKVMRSGHFTDELARHVDIDRLNGLLDGRIPSANAQSEVYHHLVLAACRFYNALLPDLFERLDDETELLLPDDLLTDQSVAHGFRHQITDEDCSEVEILGWLYQFYISERKDQVMARKSVVPKEDIPAVTQLFTPHWIVRYLVENSMGRLWLLNRPDSPVRERMPYYIECPPEADFLRIVKPEEIRILDPACGSGHMLTYAFDLLYAIYEEEGYAATEIPGLILKHNLYGLDICPRAAQLAELALLFKAREKCRQFFQPVNLFRPNIMELREIRFTQSELRDYIHAFDLEGLFDEAVLRLMYQFEDAKNFGSLIHPSLDEQTITLVRGTIEGKNSGGQLFLHETHLKVLRVLEQAEALAQRYQIAIANPPYMGNGGMNPSVKKFAKDYYANSKADLFGMFMERAAQFCQQSGYFAMVTMQAWMFLSSFENLRTVLLDNSTIITLAQIGFNSFPEMNSKIAQACAFVFRLAVQLQEGLYLNLNDAPQSANKEEVFLDKKKNGEIFHLFGEDFKRIPGSPIAYWLTKADFDIFKHPSLERFANVCIGMKTGDNPFFLRSWQEVSHSKIGLNLTSLQAANQSNFLWFPYLKGGDYRKWHGNYHLVVRWKENGKELLEHVNKQGISDARIRPSNFTFYFKPGINWSFIGSGVFNVRIHDDGFFFDVAGSSLFPTVNANLNALAGILNSKVASLCLAAINPTLNVQIENIKALPVCMPSDRTRVVEVVSELKKISKEDWENFETSWDFQDFPLLRPCMKHLSLQSSWNEWKIQLAANVQHMQVLETENNRHFIGAYGLQGEISPEVSEKQIAVARADPHRDMAAFISYAVGCMMGRYSLDKPGLILADAGATIADYLAKVGKCIGELTFAPDEDGIISVLDGEWFEDDIVGRTREFLRSTFGDTTLRDNIRFIEESLGKDLRKYFLTEFYKDHLQFYRRRPIYWMVQSPKKGFSVLIYLHRYTRDTMNLVLNRYLREFEAKLRNRIAHLEGVQNSTAVSAREKSAARKEFNKLTAILHECQEWERQVVLPLAQARIELDLDDGVKVNYLKLGEALAPIPGLAVSEE